MEEIFKGIDTVIDGEGTNAEALKSYLNQDISRSLSLRFIQSISENHDFVPQFNIHVSTRTILVNNENLYLELELLEPNHDKKIFVSNNNCSQAVGVLKGTANLKIFDHVSDNTNELTLSENKTLNATDTVSLDNSYYIIENPSQTPLLLLFATNKKSISRGSSVPAYRVDSGKFSHFVSSRLASSRLETMLSIMADMGYKDCSDIVKKLASTHDDYFVRWESIRTYLRLNSDVAVPYLTDILKTETHPHVRNAAQKSLELIKGNLANVS
ncbi:HEAT repeat domain-containing protein [Alteromonas portus]|uniref:HEAT repeat domain-containing protein n=1 Tax=Alteromonas portus TaxID=2565549 RepID=UPI003BF7F71B